MTTEKISIGYEPTYEAAKALSLKSEEELKELGFTWIPMSSDSRPPIEKGALVAKTATFHQIVTFGYNVNDLHGILSHDYWLGKIDTTEQKGGDK